MSTGKSALFVSNVSRLNECHAAAIVDDTSFGNVHMADCQSALITVDRDEGTSIFAEKISDWRSSALKQK